MSASLQRKVSKRAKRKRGPATNLPVKDLARRKSDAIVADHKDREKGYLKPGEEKRFERLYRAATKELTPAQRNRVRRGVDIELRKDYGRVKHHFKDKYI